MEGLDKVLLTPRSLQENGFLASEASLSVVRQILMTPSHSRTTKQLSILSVLMKNVRFFTQKNEELGISILMDCCKVMEYEYLENEKFVFEHGTVGNKFYIIIEGTVRVLIPVISEEAKMIPVSQLATGMAFGELALLKDQPRAASIQCVSNCHLAVLDKQNYMKIIGKTQGRILDKQIEFLKEIPFFAKWGKRKLEKLTYFFTTQKFKRKQVVYQTGSSSENVFIVKSGEFELNKRLFTEKNQFTVKVALLAKGEIFGEEEVMKKIPYKTNCVCYSEGELICISADSFISKFQDTQEDTSKKIRYEIRENRIKGFKDFFDGKKNNSFSGNKKNSTHVFKTLKKIKENDEVTRFSPLNPRQLEKIKSRALGMNGRGKVYINFNTPYENLSTEEGEKSLMCGEAFNSFQGMISHQPGGYFKGRLKRPRYRSKVSQDFTEIIGSGSQRKAISPV